MLERGKGEKIRVPLEKKRWYRVSGFFSKVYDAHVVAQRLPEDWYLVRYDRAQRAWAIYLRDPRTDRCRVATKEGEKNVDRR